MHQELSEAEDVKPGFDDHRSEEWREARLHVIGVREDLSDVLRIMVRREQFDSQSPFQLRLNALRPRVVVQPVFLGNELDQPPDFPRRFPSAQVNY